MVLAKEYASDLCIMVRSGMVGMLLEIISLGPLTPAPLLVVT